MKPLFYFLMFAFSYSLTIAQSVSPCSKYKTTQSRKSSSASMPPGYVPPESYYDLKFYHLNLNVERDTNFISGNVKSIAKVVVSSLDSFAFLLHQNHTIDSVYVNQIKRNFVRRDSLVKASTGTPIPQNQLFEAIVYYHGRAPLSGVGPNGTSGYNNYNFGGDYVGSWTLSESFMAYEWFPCKQDLRDKIDSSWVYATTDSSNRVGSNGLLKKVTTIGNKKRYEWKSRYPIDYYLISLAIGKYDEYNLYAKPQALSPDSILIQNFLYKGMVTNPAWASDMQTLNNIVPTLELQSKLFGMYPFYKEKYGNCIVPFAGGMEHQTMTTIGYLDFEVNAHELGHQWWGDNVTCSSWKDIFINEAWASYSEYLSVQYLPSLSWTTASAKMSAVHNDVMSLPGGSSYFTNADTMNMNVIFDSRLTYNKGSAIVHSLRYEINNDSVFFPAIRAFQNTYKGSTASVIDFKNFMQTFTGLNFQQFFNQWYYGEGYPTFNVTWNQVGNTFLLRSSQTPSMPGSVPLFMTHVDYRIHRTAMPDTLVRVFHGQTVENYSLTLNGNVTVVVIDPDNWILNRGSSVKSPGLTVGLEDYVQESVFVGPNPTSDVLNISVNHSKKMVVDILDVKGQYLFNQSMLGYGEIDLSKYANGLYIVNVKNDQGELIKTCKIIKN